MALEEQVVDRLIHLGYTVSFAESCTGGLCCGTLVVEAALAFLPLRRG